MTENGKTTRNTTRTLVLTDEEFRALHRVFATRSWYREDRPQTRAIEQKLRRMSETSDDPK